MERPANQDPKVWHTTLAVTVVSTDPDVARMDLDEIVVEVAEGRAISASQVTGFAQLTTDQAIAVISQLGGNPATLGVPTGPPDDPQGPDQP